jgi:hypothetical protein
MKQHIKRVGAYVRFSVAKIPHQLMHHSLLHPLVRKKIVNLIKPFPGLDRFLRTTFVRYHQKLAQERIFFQRYNLPNLVISKRRRSSPVDPADLAKTHSRPYLVDEILKNIQKELS